MFESSDESVSSSVTRGTLVAVVGTVGSGKSSFLSAMLGELLIYEVDLQLYTHRDTSLHFETFSGELTRLRGEISVTGKLAYIPQQAWIQNLSVRDNITFGRAFDRQWYEKVSIFRRKSVKQNRLKVVSACALTPDLAILPDGDATEIGEKVRLTFHSVFIFFFFRVSTSLEARRPESRSLEQYINRFKRNSD